MRLASILGSRSFAHLVGHKVAAKAKAADESNESDDDKKKREDEEARKAKRAEGDDNDDSRKTVDDEDGGEVVDDDGEDDDDDADKDARKVKKAKRADADEGDDEDDDAEMRGKSVAASARLRERDRCAAIFSSPAAAGNPALAANLAFNTRLSRKEALTVLENSAPAATARAPGEGRAARNPRLGVPGGISVEGPMTPAQEAAASAAKMLATARAAGMKV